MKNGLDIKRLVLWSMYNFGHAIALIVFFFYYSQWLVIDRGVSDFWFNMTFVGASLLFLLTVPVAGAIADKIKVNMPGLRFTTICSFIFFFLTGFIAEFYQQHYVLSAFTFAFASYFYLFCYTYYNPLLRDVAIPERHGLASGWGMFGDSLGQIFGLLVTLPLATGAIILWGQPGRAETLVPAAILFLVFSLPMLIFFKEKSSRIQTDIRIGEEYKQVFSSFIKLCALPGVGLFFLAYFFFNDAVTTASNNFPIWMQNVMGIAGTTQSLLLVLIIFAGVIGAPVSGWLADRFGFKRVLLWILAGWIVIFPMFAFAHGLVFFIVICAIMGLWYGAIWTVTRAYLLHLTPHNVVNRSFTYYTLMERLATFIGPFSWGLVVTYLPHAGAWNYRSAAILMAVFVLIGYIIARRLPESKDSIEFRRKSFGGMADDYQKYRKPYDPKVYERFFELLSRLEGVRNGNSSIKILDIGCGTGKSTEPLIQLAPSAIGERLEVIGCDHDPKMLQLARQSATEQKLPIQYMEGAAEKLSFKHEEFDAVIAGSAFHWFANEAAFREIRRVIKNGGLFFTFFKNPGRILDVDGKQVASDVYKKYKQRSIIGEWRSTDKNRTLFESVGFRDFASETLSYEQKDTLNDIIGQHKTTSKYAVLSPEDQVSFIRDLTEVFSRALDDKEFFTSTRETVACYAYK